MKTLNVVMIRRNGQVITFQTRSELRMAQDCKDILYREDHLEQVGDEKKIVYIYFGSDDEGLEMVDVGWLKSCRVAK